MTMVMTVMVTVKKWYWYGRDGGVSALVMKVVYLYGRDGGVSGTGYVGNRDVTLHSLRKRIKSLIIFMSFSFSFLRLTTGK